MATITATLAPAMGNSQRGRNPYMVEQVVDLLLTASILTVT